jgi:hypothetical protein
MYVFINCFKFGCKLYGNSVIDSLEACYEHHSIWGLASCYSLTYLHGGCADFLGDSFKSFGLIDGCNFKLKTFHNMLLKENVN